MATPAERRSAAAGVPPSDPLEAATRGDQQQGIRPCRLAGSTNESADGPRMMRERSGTRHVRECEGHLCQIRAHRAFMT